MKTFALTLGALVLAPIAALLTQCSSSSDSVQTSDAGHTDASVCPNIEPEISEPCPTQEGLSCTYGCDSFTCKKRAVDRARERQRRQRRRRLPTRAPSREHRVQRRPLRVGGDLHVRLPQSARHVASAMRDQRMASRLFRSTMRDRFGRRIRSRCRRWRGLTDSTMRYRFGHPLTLVALVFSAGGAVLLTQCSSSSDSGGASDASAPCPAAEPSIGSACSLPESTQCDSYPTAPNACPMVYVCNAGTWSGVGSSGLAPACPDTIPEAGAACISAVCTDVDYECPFACATAICENDRWSIGANGSCRSDASDDDSGADGGIDDSGADADAGD